MAFHRESRGLPRDGIDRREGLGPGGRASAPLGSPTLRGGHATPPRRRARRLGVLTTLALAACNPTIQGNGILYEEPRAVAPFTGIEVEDGVHALVTAGEAQAVTVVADANIVTGIETQVRTEPSHGQVLHVWISLSNDVQPTIPPSVVVRIPALDFVSVKDETLAEVSRAAAETMTVRAENGGNVILNGPGGRALDARLSAAALKAGTYPVAESGYLELSRDSRATLNVDGDVTGFVHDTSELDNLLGAGACVVEKDATAVVRCHEPPP